MTVVPVLEGVVAGVSSLKQRALSALNEFNLLKRMVRGHCRRRLSRRDVSRGRSQWM
jgi:hypothetical protein